MRSVLVLGLASVLTLLSACGPNCQSTCATIYGDCNIAVPGQTTDELTSRCIDRCETALENNGDLNGYAPDERHTSGTTVVLENEKQAAVWMDCVETHTCDELNEGFCAPI